MSPDPIGPGWGDPLLGMAQQTVGAGADPLLILAIVVMLAGVLVWLCGQPSRG